jgi:acetoin utilization protein AcuA
MTYSLPKETVLTTPNGDVRIRSFCGPDEIMQYGLDREFSDTGDYKSIFTRKESLAQMARQAGANVVLALVENRNIVGLGVLAEPDPKERWTRLGPGLMMEVKAIEVCRRWRSVGIAPRVIKMLLDHPRIEDVIVYLVGYSWTWDLKGAQKSAEAYSQMLIHMFTPFGFQRYETNEPNVCLKPENILMGRMGSNVSQRVRDRFKWLRYDLNLWTWSVG